MMKNALSVLWAFICVWLAAGGIALAAVDPSGELDTPLDSATKTKSYDIDWDPPRVELDLTRGESTSLDLSFTSNRDLSDVSLWIVPELRPFVQVSPDRFTSVIPGVEYDVRLQVSADCDAIPGFYAGTLHLQVGRKTYPQTLKIELDVSGSAGSLDILSPAEGEFLADDSQTVAWEGHPCASRYSVQVRTANTSEYLCQSGFTTGTSITCEDNLPTDGRQLEAIVEAWDETALVAVSTVQFRATQFTRIIEPLTGHIEADPASGFNSSDPASVLPGQHVVEIVWEAFADQEEIAGYGFDVGTTQGGADLKTSNPALLPAASSTAEIPNLPSDGADIWIRLWHKRTDDNCTLYSDCPHTDHLFSASDITNATDVVLSSISIYDSDLGGTSVDPEQMSVRKNHRAIFVVDVAVVNPQGISEPTFDLGGLEMELRGWLVAADREPETTEDTSFSQRIVLDEEPEAIDIFFNPYKQRYEMTGVEEAELFFEDVLSIIPSDYFMHHRQLYSYPFSGNHLPDLEMTDPELYHIIKDEFPPKMHFVQHVYNNHRNARDAYLINYMDDGGRHFQDIVFTFEVNIDHLAAGSYAAELHLDPDNKKYDSGENYPVDIQEDIAFSSSDPDEDPEAPVNIAGLYFGEFVYYDQCFDSDPYPSSSQAATYVYRVNHQQWDEDEEWAHHLKSFEENGVDDDTADEMAIGEVWGPFGAGCHQYAGDHIHARLGCDTWAYNSSTEITCDAKEADPSAPCFNYANNYCDPDDSTEDYEECIGKLNHFPGRPNPRDIKNVIMFFPGVLGANGGSGMTGQRAYHATQDDFQDVGDNKIMCPFRTDSLMGRIVAGRYIFDGNMVNCPYDQYQCGYANCGTCYSPENTLLVGVWDSAIDTTETQDLQILNGFEEMIALRTNMYENVERVWIVGGSRGGSTAIYLGSRIVERFKGEYSPRLPAAGLGGPTYNRIINHNLDEFGNHRDASDLKFVIAGFSPQSMTNDPDEVKHWQRVVSHPWGYHDPPDPGNRACHDCADGPDGSGSHGNGHDFVDMYSQSGEHIWSNGTTGQPTLAVISIEDDSGYDPMFHVRCDDADCENDAELGVHRDWPYCVWYWDWDGDGHDHGYPADNRCGIWDAGVPLSYAWPFEGPDGGDAGNFFTMLFPLKNDYSADGGWRRYEHNEMTREWTLFHNAVANYMFDKLFPGVAFDGGDPDLPVEALCYYEPGIEWSCWNRIDDDGDALVDLDDPDCEWTHEGYSEETCSDGIDQDEDGDIDCEDTGCCDQDICTDPYSMCRGLADCIYDCYMMCCGGSECDPCYDTCAAGCYLY